MQVVSSFLVQLLFPFWQHLPPAAARRGGNCSAAVVWRVCAAVYITRLLQAAGLASLVWAAARCSCEARSLQYPAACCSVTGSRHRCAATMLLLLLASLQLSACLPQSDLTDALLRSGHSTVAQQWMCW